jgi:hypothetical protein
MVLKSQLVNVKHYVYAPYIPHSNILLDCFRTCHEQVVTLHFSLALAWR